MTAWPSRTATGPNAVLVSIHYDASGSSARGVHTFFWHPDSYGLAVRVQRHLVGSTGLGNLGVVRRVLRLTHNPTVPSILCECGFLTNREEAALVSTPAFRQRIAQGITDGILEEQEKGDVNIGTLPPINRPVVTGPSYTHHTGRSHRETMSRVRSRPPYQGRAGEENRSQKENDRQEKDRQLEGTAPG